MRPLFSRRSSLSAVLVCALAAIFRGAAQAQSSESQPRWLTLDVNEASVGAYGEIFEETVKSPGSSALRETRLFAGPETDLDLSGSIYHPNLATYHIRTDLIAGWESDEYSGPNGYKRNGFSWLGSENSTVDLLDGKPLHGSLSSSYAHTYQDYDFFDRVYMDTWHYGGSAAYAEGPLSFSASAFQDTEDATGYGTPTKADRTSVAFNAADTREFGSTSVGYNFSRYTRTDYGVLGYGEDHTITASDLETFGSRKEFESRVNLTYNHLDDYPAPSDLFTVAAGLTAHHTERLTSDYLVNYSRETADGIFTDSLNGNADVQYRLFDSLVSSFGLQGYRSTASDEGSSQSTWQFGGGPGLNYTKELGAHGTLTAYENLLFLHTDIQGDTGVIPAIDESHTFGANGAPADSFYLDHPTVTVVTSVRSSDGRVYTEGTDYIIEQVGNRTMIRRISGQQVSDTVMVSYFYDSPPGSYDTVNNAFGIRVDLFENLWSVYLRLNTVRNSGALSSVVQDLDDLTAGTEVNWRALRGGVEYEDYHSSLAPFTAWRLFQGVTVHPDPHATLNLTFNESFMHFDQPAHDEQYYSAILRYSQSLTRSLSVTLETGVSQRVGPGIDQTLLTVRPMLQYTAGKFSASIGYDYGYDEYLNAEQRQRSMGFIRFRKVF